MWYPVMDLLKVLSTHLKAQTGDSEMLSLFLFSTRGTEKREKTGQQNKRTNKTKKQVFPLLWTKIEFGVFSHMRYTLPPAM